MRCAAVALAALAGCQQIPPAPISAESSAAALAARSLSDPALREFIERARGSALEVWPLARWDLEALTLAALYHQASLDVARAQWAFASGGVETASARPNPALSVTPERSLNPGSAASPWLATVQIDWPIETAGKRGHRIARARALEAGARLGIDVEAWRVRRALRTALGEFAAARARGAGLAAQQALEGELAGLLEQRRQAGAVSQAEVVPLRLALLRTQTQLGESERQRLTARVRVAAAIGIPGEALAGIELDFALGDGPDPLAGDGEAEARRRALLERADVRGALDAYAALEAALRLELARQIPDLHLGPGYQYDMGQNKWGLGLWLELPLLNHNEGPIAEAFAARSEAAARFTALQAQVIADLDQALAERRSALAQVARLTELAALQENQAERARAALALGAIDRSVELAAEIELTIGQLARVDALQSLEQANTALEAALEGPSFEPETLEISGRLAAQGQP